MRGQGSSVVVTATADNWNQEIMQADKPVLVDFWADWCAPCKQLKPVLEELAVQMPSIKIVEINVHAMTGVANQFEVRSLPTMLVVQHGTVKGMVRGRTLIQLRKEVEELTA